MTGRTSQKDRSIFCVRAGSIDACDCSTFPDFFSTLRTRPRPLRPRAQRRPGAARHTRRVRCRHPFRLPRRRGAAALRRAAREPRLRHVLVRHEQAAVHAAEGYARTTGRVGVVLVTSGPGVSNTTTGLLDALQRFGADPVHQRAGRDRGDRHQRLPGMRRARHLRPVTKWNVADPRGRRRAAAMVRRAFAARRRRAARAGADRLPQGPAAAAPCGLLRRHRRACVTHGAQRRRALPPRGRLQRAADQLSTRAPAGFLRRRRADQLRPGRVRSLYPAGARAGAPCTLTLLGLGAFRHRTRTSSACSACTARWKPTWPCTTPT